MKIVKEELLGSILEMRHQDHLDLEEMAININNLREAAILIKIYEDLLKSKSRRIINIARVQGLLLKRFNEEEVFLDLVGLSRSHAYFKKRLYDFLTEYTLLKN